MDQAVEFVRRNIETVRLQDGVRREGRWDYPPEAVREVVVNAVVHRDYLLSGTDIELSVYSDRLEVVSPGRLPNGITPARMRAGCRSARNELLKDVMRDYGYLEHMGMGVSRKIVRGMREHNGTEPDLVEGGERFTVRLWKEARANLTLIERHSSPTAAAGEPRWYSGHDGGESDEDRHGRDAPRAHAVRIHRHGEGRLAGRRHLSEPLAESVIGGVSSPEGGSRGTVNEQEAAFAGRSWPSSAGSRSREDSWGLPAGYEGKHARRDVAHFLHEPFQLTVVLDSTPCRERVRLR